LRNQFGVTDSAVGVSAVLIAGPTASGKSALAIRLAQVLGGSVVNADSMQVYRDLSILTARPTALEQQDVPHLLFGHVDGAENYSTGKWLLDAAAAIAAVRDAGRLPILVGGTGLYFKALTRGIAEIPPVPADVRERIRQEAEGVAAPELHARLAACDPETAARLRPTDPQRILRALEVLAATGQPLAHFQSSTQPPILPPASYFGIFLAPDRPALLERIDRRFDAMVAEGALDEVARLAERGLSSSLPVVRAHGVPGLLAHWRGEMDLAAAIARGKLDTRHYVKRQLTFARHQLPEFQWVAPEAAEEFVLGSLRGA
jgi:tRNA dimethylallyltransferase